MGPIDWALSGWNGASACADGMVRREDFLPYVKSRFDFQPGGGPCTLVEVSGARDFSGKGIKYTGFSLLFHGAADFAGVEDNYQISHPEFGALEMFVSVLQRVVLEAVFSRAV